MATLIYICSFESKLSITTLAPVNSSKPEIIFSPVYSPQLYTCKVCPAYGKELADLFKPNKEATKPTTTTPATAHFQGLFCFEGLVFLRMIGKIFTIVNVIVINKTTNVLIAFTLGLIRLDIV